MLKKTLLILLYLLSLSLRAQSGLQIGIAPSCLFAYRSLSSQNSVGQTVKKIRDDAESLSVGFGISADVTYQTTKPIYFVSGIHLNRFGYHLDLDNPVFGNASSPQYGFSSGAEGKVRFTTLSIPLQVGCLLNLGNSGNHFLKLQTGINNHLLLAAKSYATYTFSNGNTTSQTNDIQSRYNGYYISSLTGIGYEFRKENHAIGAMLSVDYGISPLSKQSSIVHERMYYGGLTVGYFYSLGK